MGFPGCAENQVSLRPPKYLRKGAADEPCIGPEAQRRQISNALDCWVNKVEIECGLKTPNPDPCAGCYPEFTCLIPHPAKRPFCPVKEDEPLITSIPIFERRLVSEKQRVADQGRQIEMKLVEDSYKAVPVWERPRLRSQKLIGGEYKKLTECFKKNGLVSPECPRTPSCRVVRNMQEWIELDKGRKESRKLNECCCCPGVVSTLPRFKCINCEQNSPKRNSRTPTSNRIVECLHRKNPRSSRDIKENQLNMFGHHKEE